MIKSLKFLVLALVLSPNVVFAIEAKSFKDWEYVCPDKTGNNCFLSHIVTDKTGEELLMQVLVGKIKENQYPILAFQFPPMLKDGQSVNVALENEAALTFDVKGCNEVNCQAFGALSPEFAKDFRASKAGIAQFQTPEQLVKIYFSLNGFSEALDYFTKHVKS